MSPVAHVASLLSQRVILVRATDGNTEQGRGGFNHPVIGAVRTEVCQADKRQVYIFAVCVTHYRRKRFH